MRARACCGATALGLLLALPLGAAAAEPVLRVAAAPQVMEAGPLLYAAQQIGAGVVVVPGGVPTLFAPGDQAAELAGNAETQALRVSVEHPDLRIIQTVVEGLYSIVARRSAGIAAVKDLKGKRLGVTASTSAAYFAHKMLLKAGLDDADVTLVSLAPNDLPGALAERKVDAIAIWEPQGSQGEAALGADAVTFPGTGVHREVYNLNTTAAALADPVRRARIVAFVKALADGSLASVTAPAKVWPLVARSSGFSEPVIAAGWPHHRFGAALVPDLLDVLEEEERWLAPQAKRPVRPRAQLAKLIDASVVVEAMGKPPPPQVDPVTTIVRIDTDHDGAASRAEWVAYGNHDAGFPAIDADHDGRITVAELRAFRALNAKTDAERAALKAENPKFDPEITIRMADTNRDGRVTEAEWVAYGGHGGGGFAPMDANHDGKLSADELAAYRKAHPPR